MRQVGGQVGQVRGQVGGTSWRTSWWTSQGTRSRWWWSHRCWNAPGGHWGGHGEQAGGRRELGFYLSLLVLLVAQRHSTQHPGTLPETLPGSFRKLPELRKTEYLLQASGKASGNLPGPSGTAAKRQITKQASGKLPETFRDLPELQRK